MNDNYSLILQLCKKRLPLSDQVLKDPGMFGEVRSRAPTYSDRHMSLRPRPPSPAGVVIETFDQTPSIESKARKIMSDSTVVETFDQTPSIESKALKTMSDCTVIKTFDQTPSIESKALKTMSDFT